MNQVRKSSDKERRKTARVARDMLVKYRCPEAGIREWQSAACINISSDGMCLKSDFIGNSTLPLEVLFNIKGLVVKCSFRVVHRGRHKVGGVFEKMSRHDKGHLAMALYT